MFKMKKLKHLFIGITIGTMISISSIALANNPIKLIINGKEVQSDVPPQVINGRTLVPARIIAENLGVKVEWDENSNSVILHSQTNLPTGGSGGSGGGGSISASSTLGTSPSNPIKIFLNGQEVKYDLTSKGSIDNIIAMKMFAEAIGLKVEIKDDALWVTSGQSSVSSGNNTGSSSQITQITQPQLQTPIVQQNQPIIESQNATETTFNGMKAIVVNGVMYFKLHDYALKLQKISSNNKITWNNNTNQWIIHVNENDIAISSASQDIQIYKGQSYVNTKYYQ